MSKMSPTGPSNSGQSDAGANIFEALNSLKSDLRKEFQDKLKDLRDELLKRLEKVEAQQKDTSKQVDHH